jgi:hypothetical protein
MEQGSAQSSSNVSCYSETQLQLVHYTIYLKGTELDARSD